MPSQMYNMKLVLALLNLIGLFDFTVGLIKAFPPRNSTRSYTHPSGHKPLADDLQVAGDWDPTETATPQQILKYSEKGTFMSDCLLLMSDADAGKAWPDPNKRSPPSASILFRGTLETDLQAWGWAETPNTEGLGNFGSPDGGANIKRALDALGLSSLPKPKGDIEYHAVFHELSDAKDEDGKLLEPYDQIYTNKGQQYHRTGAACEFGINHIGGAIFARAIYSPMKSALDDWPSRGITPDWPMMPELRRASDIMAGYWLRNNPKGLKYYFALGIQNDETNRVISSILLDKQIYGMPEWPGVKLDVKSGYWGARAMLGSPIGSTITHLLLQHKAKLGIKHVTEIVIFREDKEHEEDDPDDEDDDEEEWEDVTVHLLFKIEDVPEDEEMPDAPDGEVKRGRMMVKKAILRGAYHPGDDVRVHEFRMV